MLVRLKLDDLDSGLTGINSSGGYDSIGYIDFVSPNGKQSISANIKSSDRISGNKFSGTYQVPIPLKSFHQPGLWTLTNLDIEDDAGNDLIFTAQGSGIRPLAMLSDP